MTDLSAELDKLEKKEEIFRDSPYFKFTNPGDSIQGTLVSRTRIMSQLGQDQIAYIVKNAEGLHKVAFNATYPIHREVENAVVGQEVRFNFTGTKPSKIKGYSPIKLMTAITRPDLLNTKESEWLTELGLRLGDPLPSVSGSASEEEEGVTEHEEEEVEEQTARPAGSTLPRRSA